jgi:NitT/TauT family transport system ATP-binding protein
VTYCNVPPVAMGAIEITGLSHQYVDTDGLLITAIQDVSLSVQNGRFISIVGPSGCGKTTLLNIVGGFIPATSGSVLIDGKPVLGPGPDRGVVFQSYALFDWLNVRENIEFGPRMAGIKAHERSDRANRYLSMVGLRKFANRYPYELSGGMKQRVAIARALANSPEILLMDEPFASLDAQTRELMQEELLKIWETTNRTVLFITHSVDEAVYLSTEVAVMSYRPGRLKKIFPVSLPYPRAEYSIRTDPRFLELKVAIHDLVRQEISKHVDEDS